MRNVECVKCKSICGVKLKMILYVLHIDVVKCLVIHHHVRYHFTKHDIKWSHITYHTIQRIATLHTISCHIK
jgi:hypothetical protein